MRGLNHRLAALVALTCAALLITAVSAIASVPVAHSSATCSDYSNQADFPFAQAAHFRAAERRAKVGRRGVWRLCGGNFHRPATDTSASASASRYRGYIDALNGSPVREGSQGAGWRAIFRERAPGRVRYTVCLRNLDNDVGNCWRARTDRRGSSRVFVALFVNDRGGPGEWQARWKLGGRVVASWRFRVRPEFG
jgi:hypothetical protein